MKVTEQQIEVGGLQWFYREGLPVQERGLPPVLLLHGIPSQSYSWREVLPVLAEQGLRAIAPDWIGSGFSSKPEPRDFGGYTPEAYLKALAEIETGFQTWEQPTLVAWGMEDPWLPFSVAEQFASAIPQTEVVKLEQMGHYPQEDWHEKVSQALIPFLRRQAI